MLGVDTPGEEREITGYSIDSRSVRPGELFFAIRGPNHDGHAYAEAAVEAGAAAVVAERSWAISNVLAAPLIAADDTADALRRLARAARRHWNRPIVAVTGSNGKTTTKELISAALSVRMKVAKSAGNLNNEFGLPLSLLRFDDDAEVGVVEMGMNHAGEIRRLAQIAEPTVGVVTNVNAVHLEFFDSVDSIALAKRELIEGLPANGTAVLNADDARVRGFASAHPGRTVTFGIDEPADIRAVDLEENAAPGVRFRAAVRGKADAPRFSSSLPGRHNVSNMLAAIATASVFGIAPAELPDALSTVGAGRMRGEILDLGGVRVISDCYNSNPRAVAAMLDVLRASPAERRIAVLGEMRELGASSVELHRETGKLAGRSGLDLLIGVAGDAREIAGAAREAGMPEAATEFFDTAQQAGERLARIVRPGDYVLLKGSRGVALEQALAILESARGQAAPAGAEGRG